MQDANANAFFFLVKNASPVKRGRGRPRKDSLGSNMSQVQAYFLDEGKTHTRSYQPTYHIHNINNYADLSYTHTHKHIYKLWAHIHILTVVSTQTTI